MQGVKLPTIKLPTFDGRYEGWLEFRDTYLSLIHSNNAISEIQKFHYLRAALEGSAAQVIHSIEFSDKNYTVAWDAVDSRYNNTSLLINDHIKAIFNMETISRESAVKIRELVDKTSKHLRSLETLNEPVGNWDTLIIFIVVNKLDSVTAREWEEHKVENNSPTLKDLNKFLRGKADMLETIEGNNQNRKQDVKPKTNEFKNKNQVACRGFLVSDISCAICKDNHTFYNCKDFLGLPVEQRIEKVRNLKLCVNCLKPGHYGRFCRLGPCRKCKGKHNSLLHFDRPGEYTNTQSSGVASTSNLGSSNSVSTTDGHDGKHRVDSSKADNVVSLNHSAAIRAHQDNDQALLSTALINILDKYGRPHAARALLDSAAQSSFLTVDLCKKLQLDVENIEVSVMGLSN